MARSSRFPSHDPLKSEERRDRWLSTYSSFVTLLFAMFLVLYAISQYNEKSFTRFINTLANTSSNTLDPGDSNSLEQFLLEIRELQQEESIPSISRIEMLSNHPTTQQVLAQGSIRKKLERFEIEFSSGVLFRKGSATLTQNAKQMLQQLATLLKQIDSPLKIEGYSDNTPIKSARFPSNWELSAARATAVLRELAQQGVNTKRMAAVSYGEHRPILSSRLKMQALNRRVLIVIESEPGALTDTLKQQLQHF